MVVAYYLQLNYFYLSNLFKLKIMEKKQSSIEWLENQLKERYSLMNSEPLFEQAKQMEKEQIEKAFVIRPYTNFARKNKYNSGFEEYYNETFGGNND